MRFSKKAFFSTTLIFVLLALAGCGNASGPNSNGGSTAKATDSGTSTSTSDPQQKPNQQPIKLSIYRNYVSTDEQYQTLFMDNFKKKSPNIEFDMVYPKVKSEAGQTSEYGSLQQLVIAGSVPDILILPNTATIKNTLIPMNLNYDMTDLIKKYKVDLSQFTSPSIDLVKQNSKSGEIDGLPIYNVLNDVLVYNKDLFDKFGVPYPVNGMTWDQTLELGKKMTRTVDGVNYQGFDPGLWNSLWQEYGLNVYDSKTGKTTLLSDSRWTKVMQLFKDAYQSNGQSDKIVQNRTPFMNGKVAMLAWVVQSFTGVKKDSGLNFDFVSMPTWADAKGQGISPEYFTVTINPKSNHKDEAFQLIQTLLTPEAQQNGTRKAYSGTIHTLEMKDLFAKDLPNMEGKHPENAIYNKMTLAPPTDTNLDTIGQQQLITTTIPDIASGKVDINTALRQADDAITQKIKTEQSK